MLEFRRVWLGQQWVFEKTSGAMVTLQDMNFSWVIPGKLAGCRAPWRELEVQFLKEQGVQVLVRLQELDRLRVSSDDMVSLGVEDLAYPVPDGGAPSPGEAAFLVEFIHNSISKGKRVAVACGGGIGRTGTLLACYLVFQGMHAQQAMSAVRAIRSPSIETRGQEQAVHEYAKLLSSGDATATPSSSVGL